MRTKTFIIFCCAILLLSLGFLAQDVQKSKWKGKINIIDGIEVIINPKKPMNERGGRVLELKEVWRISDIGKNFYFKSPRSPKIASDGSVFIRDTEQILKFSPEGKFEKNLFKLGKGPGEISGQSSFSYDVFQDEILVYDSGSGKKMRMDFEGNLKEEKKLDSRPGSFLWATDNWLTFFRQIWPPREDWNARIYELKNLLVCEPKRAEVEKRSFNFPTKIFLAYEAASSWSDLIWTINKNTEQIFVSHSREYLIEQLDLNAGKIVRGFRRKYPSVKHKMTESEEKFYKRHHSPKKKYESDIRALFVYKDLLWVQTSTKDPSKGILIDVFDNEGKFIDNFYLDIEGSFKGSHEDSVFVQDQDEDGNIKIVKYRIE